MARGGAFQASAFGGTAAGIRVRGLRELSRAFKVMPEEIKEEFVWELEEAADPVRKRATELILSDAGPSGVQRTPVYAAMRIGVAKGVAVVYVAPAWRARKSSRSRPNISGIYQPLMEQAANENKQKIVDRVEDMIYRIADNHGFD